MTAFALIEETTRILAPYQEKISAALDRKINTLGPKNTLRDACEYALSNGGKRFRPALVYLIADGLGNKHDVTEAALAVELFHTASLIADDLPCMDNDDERRNKPSLHKVYGETVALLSSYALIAAGYECLAKNSQSLNNPNADKICVLALENATHNTGLLGATGGQFLDVYPTDLSLTGQRDVINKKTVSLFEISFVLGWLFGGGDLAKLHLVKKAAAHFGMAFQIADDIDDQTQDLINHRKINIANATNVNQATKMFHVETQQFLETLQQLNIQLSFATVLRGSAPGTPDYDL
ncbi:MAG: polyprenyl synthetase family protein [Parachlamydiaceae bacterium]|nr:polyprenyl synthetase family protein [Parachlamydiaceae bacterium]